MEYRLGKLEPREDPRTLKLANYLDLASLPIPPESLDLSHKVPTWPMYGNDRLGNCTIAAAGHMIELWTAMRGHEASVAERTVERVYKHLSPQDRGCYELDVLRYWRQTGITKTHRLHAFAAVDIHNPLHIRLALALFGGVYLGIALPTSAQAQTGPDKLWDVGSQAGGWGGHAVNVVGYDAGTVSVVTWGFVQRMTWGFWSKYVDEAWALLGEEWAKGVPIPGVNFAQLNADLAQIGKPA